MDDPRESDQTADGKGTAVQDVSITSPSLTEDELDHDAASLPRSPPPILQARFTELQDLLLMEASSLLTQVTFVKAGDIIPIRFYEPPRGATQIRYILVLRITRRNHDLYCTIAPIYTIDPLVYMHERFAPRQIDFLRLVNFMPGADDEYSVGYQGHKLPLGSCIKLSTVMTVLQDLSLSFPSTRGLRGFSAIHLDKEDLEMVRIKVERKKENGEADSSLDDGAFTEKIRAIMSFLYTGVAFEEVDDAEKRKVKRVKFTV